MILVHVGALALCPQSAEHMLSALFTLCWQLEAQSRGEGRTTHIHVRGSSSYQLQFVLDPLVVVRVVTIEK